MNGSCNLMPQRVKYSASRVHTPRSRIPIYWTVLHLKRTDHTKYLGIHISKDLKWNKHIDVTTAKANRSLGFLKRNLKISSRVLREKAYTGFVRPQIEYGAAIWDPRPGVENNGAHKTEMVQRRAARWTLKRYHNTSSVSADETQIQPFPQQQFYPHLDQ